MAEGTGKDDTYSPNAWGKMRSYLALQGFKQAWIDSVTDQSLSRGENAERLAAAMHETPQGDVGISLFASNDATVISWSLQNALVSLEVYDDYWCLALASDGPRTMGKVLVSVTPGQDYRLQIMGHDSGVANSATIDIYDGDETGGTVNQQGDILHVGTTGSPDWQDLDEVITAVSSQMTVGLGSVSPNTGRFVLARLTAE